MAGLRSPRKGCLFRDCYAFAAQAYLTGGAYRVAFRMQRGGEAAENHKSVSAKLNEKKQLLLW